MVLDSDDRWLRLAILYVPSLSLSPSLLLCLSLSLSPSPVLPLSLSFCLPIFPPSPPPLPPGRVWLCVRAVAGLGQFGCVDGGR